MLAEVRYRGYGPPYRATYNILHGECATVEPLSAKAEKASVSTPFSAQVFLTYMGLRHNA